jgi:tRNA threonylcarbamoyl adenosine modification protein YeaZ
MTRGDAHREWLLAIDTATTRIVVAAGDPDGSLIRTLSWPAEHRHGERLLPGVEELLAETGLARSDLVGIVVGTGPGAFTGLRVGLATAKTLAHATGTPIAGIGTGAALLRAADAAESADRVGQVVLILPAGPHDRVEVRDGGSARLLTGGTEPSLGPSDVLVAVDLAGRAPEDALARGGAALSGLAVALVELGAERLHNGDGDDPERLVPEYVTLPRGVLAASGEIEWSHGPR